MQLRVCGGVHPSWLFVRQRELPLLYLCFQVFVYNMCSFLSVIGLSSSNKLIGTDSYAIQLSVSSAVISVGNTTLK